MTAAITHRSLIACRDHISTALSAEMCKRPDNPSWIEDERLAVVAAANTWVALSGQGRRITVDDVLHVEPRAIGHFDYQSKLCLYVAEVVLSDASDGVDR